MRRLVTLCAAALLTPGCFAGSPTFEPPTPSQTVDLVQRVEADSSDVSAVVSLAVLRLRTGEDAAALALLEGASTRFPGDPALALLLPIAYERMGDYPAARAGYEAYRYAHVGSLADRAAARVAAVAPYTLALEIQALATGSAPPRETAERDRVVVLPPAYVDGDAETEADAAAAAEFTAWDLSDNGWNVVDGARVRLLLDAMGVQPSDRADLSVGIEVARRLGADRVVLASVQSVSAGVVIWDATVVSAIEGTSARLDHVSIQGDADQVLPLQRRLAVMARLALDEDPMGDRSPEVYTLSSTATRAFGRGLLAMDRGDAAEAYEGFSRAAELDPSFERPVDLARTMMAAASAPPLDELALETARVGELQRVVAALMTAPASTHQGAESRVGRRERPLLSEMLGLDVLTGDVLLDLSFGSPGGGE